MTLIICGSSAATGNYIKELNTFNITWLITVGGTCFHQNDNIKTKKSYIYILVDFSIKINK